MRPIQHWKCLSCKAYNDVLNMHCWLCRADKPDWLPTLYQIGVEFDRAIFFGYGVLGYGLHTLYLRNGKPMTKEEELFSEFYNKERILVKDMDLVQLREHRELLAKIALEAKARCTASDEELRERKAKTSKKDWLITDQPVSDLINVPEVRKKRMSRMDKIKADLSKFLPDDVVKTMTRNMEAKATADASNLKTITFKKPAQEISAVTVKAEPNGKPKTPFNPASLGFRCRNCGQKPCVCANNPAGQTS